MNQRHLYVFPLSLHEPPGVDLLGESLDHQAVSVLVFLYVFFTPEMQKNQAWVTFCQAQVSW